MVGPLTVVSEGGMPYRITPYGNDWPSTDLEFNPSGRQEVKAVRQRFIVFGPPCLACLFINRVLDDFGIHFHAVDLNGF